MEIFFHRMLVNFAVNFIVFIHRFESRKEVTIIKDRCRAIILNVIPNPWTKGQYLKIWSIFSIFRLQRWHMFVISNLLVIRNSQVGRASLITIGKTLFLVKKLISKSNVAFFLSKVHWRLSHCPSCLLKGKLTILRETPKNLILNGRGRDWNNFNIC